MKRKELIRMFGITEKQSYNKIVSILKELGDWEFGHVDHKDIKKMSFEKKIETIFKLTNAKIKKNKK